MWSVFRSAIAAAALTLGLMAGLLPSQAAAPVEAKEFAALLIMHAGANGVELEIDDAVTIGNDVILRDVAIDTEPEATKFAEVRLEDVRALPRGGYMIGRITVPASKQPGPDGTWSIGALTLGNILVPLRDDKAAPAFYIERVEMEPSRLTADNGAVIADIGAIRWIGSPYAAGQDLTSKLEPFTIAFDKTRMGADDDAGSGGPMDVLRMIGGPKIKATISGMSTWRDSDGRTTFATSVDVVDVGKLTFNLGLTGLTSEILRDVYKSGASASTEATLATLSAFGQTLKLDALGVRFDDASYTRKALDAASKKAGQTRAQYVAQLKAMLPLATAALNDPKLAQQAVAAVSAYLDDPKSIEISLKPPKGATILELGMLVMTAPQTVARRLNVQVTANK